MLRYHFKTVKEYLKFKKNSQYLILFLLSSVRILHLLPLPVCCSNIDSVVLLLDGGGHGSQEIKWEPVKCYNSVHVDP